MRRAFLPFVATLAMATAFVWITGARLPTPVASHFGAGGVANAHMSKELYMALMLGLLIAVPLAVSAFAFLAPRLPSRLVNLPNKDYWLAPERRNESMRALGTMTIGFALVVTLFLCFVHWLVVEANALQPPRLNEARLFAGLGVFGALTLAWVFALLKRFGLASPG